ncbi:hypothetical protein Purlil1_13083 [Purpureocillium lilacinum]|uniref:Uncharacterized protein n=1 Tax=Purpureocillium lilacinum TaxID=33203 RepID=A0ABR0BFE4_PURLI|nr:hypothetical protein Purlil1_13083 [Purpureocillium lilacinum]
MYLRAFKANAQDPTLRDHHYDEDDPIYSVSLGLARLDSVPDAAPDVIGSFTTHSSEDTLQPASLVATRTTSVSPAPDVKRMGTEA